jgi:uncharacterized protein (DUF58 family)
VLRGVSSTSWRAAGDVEPSAAKSLGRRYHFHSPGVAYAITTMVLVIGAINGQNNLLFWLFGLGVGGLIVSGILSGGALMRLTIERETPSPTSVGDQVVIRYRVSNRSRIFPAFGLVIEEMGPAKRGKLGATWPKRLTAPAAFVPYVPARGSVVVEARVGALRRGPVTLGPMRISTTFPFGLAKKSMAFYQNTEFLVRPRMAPLKPGIIDGVSGRGEAGSRLRKTRGGEEFYSLREYVPGDSMRAVAWRSTARRGHAVVREMASRPSRRLWVVMELSGLEDREVERVVSVAGAVCLRALDAGLEPGLALAGGRVLEPARSGRRHITYLLDSLGRLDVGWVLGNSDQLAMLGSSAHLQDAFVAVDGGSSASQSAIKAALRISVEDGANYSSTEKEWKAVIEGAGTKAGEGIWRGAADLVRRATGRGGAP